MVRARVMVRVIVHLEHQHIGHPALAELPSGHEPRDARADDDHLHALVATGGSHGFERLASQLSSAKHAVSKTHGLAADGSSEWRRVRIGGEAEHICTVDDRPSHRGHVPTCIAVSVPLSTCEHQHEQASHGCVRVAQCEGGAGDGGGEDGSGEGGSGEGGSDEGGTLVADAPPSSTLRGFGIPAHRRKHGLLKSSRRDPQLLDGREVKTEKNTASEKE